MPHFYFDIREGVRFTPDEDGLEFPNLDTAEREAAEAADRVDPEPIPPGDNLVQIQRPQSSD